MAQIVKELYFDFWQNMKIKSDKKHYKYKLSEKLADIYIKTEEYISKEGDLRIRIWKDL